eukprot:TRINITY_DN6540_c0_g1_i2.p1 TRINITY_DN6540_c0_g1~~TRINITY_DN6540_c0_g1_i2.p1  ORF type:complete len:573 (+),score=174.60 TRINITY_DN6540_c0_g1_i2:630-2348(+)
MQVEYKGFVPQAGWTPKRVAIGSLDSKSFFDKFVATRTPVVIVGHIDDPEWKGSKWDLSYLSKQAGDSIVDVEVKDETGAFGKGNKVQMTFGEFLKGLKEGNQDTYITTQKIEENEQGAPLQLFGPPLISLKEDFPLTPKLFGNMLLNTVNLWMGSSKDGTSSGRKRKEQIQKTLNKRREKLTFKGLHHDFHDNLYVLVKGKKRFTIAAPSDAPYLYTKAKISKIHKNGLINYDSNTRADGSLVDGGDSDDEEPEMDFENNQGINADLYKKLLNIDDQSGSEEESEDSDLPAPDWGTLLQKGEEEEDSEDYDLDAMWANMEALQQKYSGGSKAKKSANDSKKGKASDKEKKQDPGHFSSLNLVQVRKNVSSESLTPKNLKKDKTLVKNYPEAVKAVFSTFTISEGEMLYLPASWFHEVVSLGQEKDNTHIALNYWAHPPDTESSEAPYSTDFWQRFLFKTFPELKAVHEERNSSKEVKKGGEKKETKKDVKENVNQKSPKKQQQTTPSKGKVVQGKGQSPGGNGPQGKGKGQSPGGKGIQGKGQNTGNKGQNQPKRKRDDSQGQKTTKKAKK